MSNTDDHHARLVESLQSTVPEVMSTMAFAEVAVTGISEKPEFCVSGPAAGLMLLIGERKGMVGVSMPELLARGAIANITGVDPLSLSEPDVIDGIGELTNMLSGGMKTKVADPGIQLSPPIAALGDEYLIEWKTGRPTTVLELEMSGERFTVHVCTL